MRKSIVTALVLATVLAVLPAHTVHAQGGTTCTSGTFFLYPPGDPRYGCCDNDAANGDCEYCIVIVQGP
jgi:hypothetical protein